MTTTKSYLAGLGMTGIVIASVLVLLAVGTGLVAFDGRRDFGGGGAPLERVVVGKGARSAGGERGSRDPDAPAPPGAAARPPLAATSRPVPQSVRGPGSTGGRHLVRRPGTGDGGVQARTRDSLGGGVPARDASEDGGGAAADGPPGRAKRGAGAPPGRSGGGARSSLPGRTDGRAPTATPDRVRERAGGHGRGPALGRAKRRVEQALDSGALPALLP
jgi:hypothetical protein